MPRNGSGTMSIPTTFVANTPALAADVNTNFTDVATALTASLAIDGQSAMTGQFKAADGSAAAPGITFSSDLNTGIYRIGSDSYGLAAGGALIATVNTSGITFATGKTLTLPSGAGGFIPSGGIIMWSGTVAAIPSGWFLCNGSNGTPDLRDRFIIGARQDDAGAAKTNVTGALTVSGGTKDAINVSHTHTATVTDTGHTHTTELNYTTTGGAGSSRQWYGRTGSLDVSGSSDAKASSAATTGVTVLNSTEGSSGTNANLPPYYALAFIMKS
jgi:hypothetical protein